MARDADQTPPHTTDALGQIADALHEIAQAISQYTEQLEAHFDRLRRRDPS